MFANLRIFAMVLLAVLATSLARGEDRFLVVDLKKQFGEEVTAESSFFSGMQTLPYISVLPGSGHDLATEEELRNDRALIHSDMIAIRIPEGEVPEILYTDQRNQKSYGPALLKDEAIIEEDAEEAYWFSRANYYSTLLLNEPPGAALFRRQLEEALEHLPNVDKDRLRRTNVWARRSLSEDGVADLYARMTGGRAMEENLQLTRILQSDDSTSLTIPVNDLAGVTVREYDFTSELEGKSPSLDSLAEHVPGDNLGVFFPSFSSFVGLRDALVKYGTSVVDISTDRAAARYTEDRYGNQLCLPMSALARTLGPAAIGEMAITTEDLYLVEGTAIALLFRAPQPELLTTLLKMNQENARRDPTASATKGTINGTQWFGIANPTLTISSYYAQVGDLVVVTNSQPLLERILTLDKKDSLAQRSDYRFFRARYEKGAAGEDALFVMSDAAIRKWVSPRWRIADGRRRKAAAMLFHIAAANHEAIIAGNVKPDPVAGDYPLAGDDQFLIDRNGPSNTLYGSLHFLKPISEIPVDKVSESERSAYDLFRRQYEGLWRTAFDPIALRVSAKDGIDLDLTIRPLVSNSDYRDWIELTSNGEIAPRAGDPHPDAVAHFIMHLNKDSRFVRMLEGFASAGIPGLRKPFAWIGNHVEIYLDQSPLIAEALESNNPQEDFGEDLFLRLPFVASIDVKSGPGLVATLVALRASIDQTTSEMVEWGNSKYRGVPIVSIVLPELDDSRPTLNYVARPDGWTLTLNEPALHRAIDRRLDPPASGDLPSTATIPVADWLGKHVGFAVHRQAWELYTRMEGGTGVFQSEMKNLPILNEWKRLYPDQDPVAVHRRVFAEELYAPGGSGYRWNDELHLIESIKWGYSWNIEPHLKHTSLWPFEDLDVIRAGLTFEDNNEGLRARLRVEDLPQAN